MKKYSWKFGVPIKVTDVETGKEEIVEMVWVEQHYIPDPRKKR